MNNEKLIDEMAKEICASDILCHTCGESTYAYCADAIAERLYSAGYRLASEVAREIFDEIAKASVNWGCYCVTISKSAVLAEDVDRTLTELKKKYTEGCDG